MIFPCCKIEGNSRFMSIHWLYWLGRVSWRFSSAYLFSNMFCTHLITNPIQKQKNNRYTRTIVVENYLINILPTSIIKKIMAIRREFTFYWILRCPWGKACCEGKVLHTLFHFLLWNINQFYVCLQTHVGKTQTGHIYYYYGRYNKESSGINTFSNILPEPMYTNFNHGC